ncbi:hypothetical protein Q31a_04960 [Aureliella helgolandensis]|uniref:Uncharacterized protein n=1 Tax=Aureliella helgolandensis TaxID=2527968 RepID=A0A518G0T2_9BACT|nr:hypothetical protein Q31a_04960 [Aureliella helgolandensis]
MIRDLSPLGGFRHAADSHGTARVWNKLLNGSSLYQVLFAVRSNPGTAVTASVPQLRLRLPIKTSFSVFMIFSCLGCTSDAPTAVAEIRVEQSDQQRLLTAQASLHETLKFAGER